MTGILKAMAQISVLHLTKHYGTNVAGETAGFTPALAAHIIENKGGKLLAEYDSATDRCVIVTGKDGALEAKVTKLQASAK
jgi:hypothetical protein